MLVISKTAEFTKVSLTTAAFRSIVAVVYSYVGYSLTGQL